MSDLEIRQQIARYVDQEIAAASLEDWLQSYAWETEDSGGPLAADTLRLLAEYANGDWTDSDLRERMAGLNRTYWFENAPKNVVPDSMSTVIPRGQRSVASGRPLVAESA
jgi:hypothetical protein